MTTDNPRFLGHRIRELAKIAGIGRFEIARRMGVSEESVRNWWNNRYPVPMLRLRSLTRALQCDFEDLIPELAPKIAVRPIAVREDHPPLVNDWACVCIACGQRIYARWTDQQAALYMRASTVKCGRCRGAILIERADLGAIGTSRQAHNGTYAELATRWGSL